MKIKLIDKPSKEFSPKVQVCLNRGIKIDEIKKYLSCGFGDINPPEAFDEKLLKEGARKLIKAISTDSPAFIVIDSDCDGMTSAALLINYLYTLFPSWVKKNLIWQLHEGKQHGLSDMMEIINEKIIPTPWTSPIIICPDSASNDIAQIETLYHNGFDILILDHHITEQFSEYATTINSQYDYPNKELSGAGVVYQFCKYLDKLLNQDIADNFLDLVAIGLQGDMMSMLSLETKELIFKGLTEEHIKNPLIFGLSQKNAFALSKADYLPSSVNNLKITPMGASFFIVPLLNAICRSGTIEEKNLVFDAMLIMRAFVEIPSTKRGHKLGEMERVVDQALRTCTNVKNRQTRSETQGLEFLEEQIEKNNLLDNKVLVLTVNESDINRNITGLVANKIANKFQRPTCVTFRDPNDNIYFGSMRGYTQTGIDNFKSIAETSAALNWCRG